MTTQRPPETFLIPLPPELSAQGNPNFAEQENQRHVEELLTASVPERTAGSPMSIIPGRSAQIIALQLFVDGYPDTYYVMRSRVSNLPLEFGATISDHAVAQPIEIRMRGWVRDGDVAAFREIRRLMELSEPVAISTRWAYHGEMIITKCEPRPRGLTGMRFNLECQEIQRVGVTPTDINQDTATGEAAERTDTVQRGTVFASRAASVAAVEAERLRQLALPRGLPNPLTDLDTSVFPADRAIYLEWTPPPNVDDYEVRWGLAPFAGGEWRPVQVRQSGDKLRAVITNVPLSARPYEFQLRVAGHDFTAVSVVVDSITQKIQEGYRPPD